MEVSRTIKAKKIKADRIRKKLPVYNGGCGENPCPTPPSIIEALCAYANEKQYSSASGIPEMQQHFKGQQIVVGNGLKPLLMIVQLAFNRMHTDGVIVHITPSWLSYTEQTRLLRLKSISIVTESSNMWRLTHENLRDSFEKNNLKSKPHLIILNNPNNPTGYVYNKEEMKAFGRIFDEYGTVVVYDNIYEHMVFPSCKNAGDIRDYCSNVITGSSLSKNFAAGGYRLGWLAFPKELRSLWETCFCISSFMYTCPTTPVQYAGAHALSLSNDIPPHLVFQKTMFENISKVVVHKLKSMKLKCSEPEGAYYTLVDFEHYAGDIKKQDLLTSDELCFYLAEHLGLITIAGSAFGIQKPYVLRYSMIDIKQINVQKKSFNFFAIEQFMHVLEKWLKEISS